MAVTTCSTEHARHFADFRVRRSALAVREGGRGRGRERERERERQTRASRLGLA